MLYHFMINSNCGEEGGAEIQHLKKLYHNLRMISISTMSTHCLGPTLGLVFMSFIIICGNFRETDGFDYHDEKSTIGQIFTKRGSTVWLNWNFTLSPSKRFRSFKCGYNDTTGITGEELVSLASRTGSNSFKKASIIPNSYAGRVEVFSSNYTIAIHGLEFSDQKLYYCKIIFDTNVGGQTPSWVEGTFASKSADVKVQGLPEFCDPNPPPSSVNLGEKANITVTICVNPFNGLRYQWNHQTTFAFNVLPRIGINKYQGSIITNTLTKDYCGRVLSLYSINQFGRSMSRNITINFLFDPSKPNAIQAFKANETCYKVQWKHENTGNCVVNYTIDLKDGNVSKWNRTVDARIESLSWCPTVATNITNADIKVVTLKGSETYSVKVMPTTSAPPTRASTEGSTLTSSSTVQTNATAAALKDDSTTWKIGVGISCALIFIGVIILCYCVKKRYDSKTDASTTWIIVGVVVGIVVAVVMAILCYVLREKGATATWATVGVGVVIIIVVFIVCYLCRKRAICKTGPKYDDSADNGSNLPLSQRNNPSETQYQQPNVRPPKGSHEPAQYAQTNSDQLLYGRLGEGGGRGTRSAKASKPSEDLYADVKLDEKGYPAQGPTTTYR